MSKTRSIRFGGGSGLALGRGRIISIVQSSNVLKEEEEESRSEADEGAKEGVEPDELEFNL